MSKGLPIEKLKFDHNKPIESSDFWYDITLGGYISPSDFSTDEETQDLIQSAIEILELCQKHVTYI